LSAVDPASLILTALAAEVHVTVAADTAILVRRGTLQAFCPIRQRKMRADPQTGERIRERRLALGLTQRGLDNATNFSYAYVSRIEAGERTPSLSALIEIAAALDTSALYLATGRHDNCPFCGRP
jgi:ribosome-binding protein aMBF1 (putative translation factor)